MPKQKTNKGAAKRFRRTAAGKIRRQKAFANHIMTKKSSKRKRSLRTGGFVHKTNAKEIEKLIPYS
ncbi:MAG: 50S ribosomal protein L35 [Proteobacteria bacterium]|nr:50S ribosomal protein L35 [Pseudomonadota bacterium]